MKPNRFSQFERKLSPTKTISQPSSQPSPSVPNSQSSIKSFSPKKETDKSEVTLLWVDKYKPTSVKQIIGQQGDKSNARKLLHWLSNWHKNRELGTKPQGKNFISSKIVLIVRHFPYFLSSRLPTFFLLFDCGREK